MLKRLETDSPQRALPYFGKDHIPQLLKAAVQDP
jgi:hypothetical protein